MVVIDALDAGFGALSVHVSLSSQPSGWSRMTGISGGVCRNHDGIPGSAYMQAGPVRTSVEEAGFNVRQKYLNHGVQVNSRCVATAST